MSRAPKPISHKDLIHPTAARAVFNRPGWIFELKYDGFRALATHRRKDVRLVSR